MRMFLVLICLIGNVAGAGAVHDDALDSMFGEPEFKPRRRVSPHDMFADRPRAVPSTHRTVPNSGLETTAQRELESLTEELVTCQTKLKAQLELNRSIESECKVQGSKPEQSCDVGSKPEPGSQDQQDIKWELYYRRHVTLLLNKLGLVGAPEDSHLQAEIKLSAADLKFLQQFRKDKSVLPNDIDHILSGMILASSPYMSTPSQQWETIRQLSEEGRDPLIMLCLSFSLAYCILFTFRYFRLWKIVLVVCIVSVCWHWLHMYKTAWARKTAQLLQHTNIPRECRPGEMSWLQSVASILKSSVSNYDHCQEYHRALLVDPIYEVNPAMAAADLALNIVFRPLRILGREFGEMFSGVLGTVPAVWLVPALLVLCMLLVLLMVLLAGYRVRLPFLLGEIGPAQAVTPGITEMIRLTIQDEVRRGIAGDPVAFTRLQYQESMERRQQALLQPAPVMEKTQPSRILETQTSRVQEIREAVLPPGPEKVLEPEVSRETLLAAAMTTRVVSAPETEQTHSEALPIPENDSSAEIISSSRIETVLTVKPNAVTEPKPRAGIEASVEPEPRTETEPSTKPLAEPEPKTVSSPRTPSKTSMDDTSFILSPASQQFLSRVTQVLESPGSSEPTNIL